MQTTSQQIIDDTLRSIKYAYTIRTSITLIGALIKCITTRKLPLSLLQLFINKDSIKFTLFLGSLTLLKKTIQYLLKSHYKGSNRLIAFISGFVAGLLSLIFLDHGSRSMYALFMLARSLDTVFLSLQQRDIIKARDYYFVIIYGLFQMVLAYAYFHEKESLANGFEDQLNKFSNFSARDMSVANAFNEINKRN